jgi:hypothetical protein
MAELACTFPPATTELDWLALAFWARLSPQERARSDMAPLHALERLRRRDAALAERLWPTAVSTSAEVGASTQVRTVQDRDAAQVAAAALPVERSVTGLTCDEVLAGLGWRATRAGQMKASAHLQALGWRRVQRRVSGRREWRYFPPGEPEVRP